MALKGASWQTDFFSRGILVINSFHSRVTDPLRRIYSILRRAGTQYVATSGLNDDGWAACPCRRVGRKLRVIFLAGQRPANIQYDGLGFPVAFKDGITNRRTGAVELYPCSAQIQPAKRGASCCELRQEHRGSASDPVIRDHPRRSSL